MLRFLRSGGGCFDLLGVSQNWSSFCGAMEVAACVHQDTCGQTGMVNKSNDTSLQPPFSVHPSSMGRLALIPPEHDPRLWLHLSTNSGLAAGRGRDALVAAFTLRHLLLRVRP